MKLRNPFFYTSLILLVTLFTSTVLAANDAALIPASQMIAQLEDITLSVTRARTHDTIDPEIASYLSEDEIIEINRQIKAYPIIEAVQEQFNISQYCGMYYDDDGYLVVVLPIDSYDLGDKNTISLNQPQRLNEFLFIEYARFTEAELKATLYQIYEEYIQDKSVTTIYGAGYGARKNAVIVEIDIQDTALQMDLIERFGEDILEFVDSEPYIGLADTSVNGDLSGTGKSLFLFRTILYLTLSGMVLIPSIDKDIHASGIPFRPEA